MKRLNYIFIYVIILNASCIKTINNVHFHGLITLDCNKQMPAKNIELKIIRYFDKGLHDADLIGTIVTDNNGYYSLIRDVKQNGSFMYYGLQINTADNTTLLRQYFGSTKSNDNSDNLEINFYAHTGKAYGFHIRNNSPFNNGDVFNSLIVSYYLNGYLHNDTVISSLIGTNVDTTLYRFYISDLVTYTYTYTKNSILSSLPEDTLAVPNCMDTVYVDIFY